jgi:hypothetical protein
LLYLFAVIGLQQAVHRAHQALEAFRPEGVSVDEFLRSVIDSFEAPQVSEEQAAKARVLARGVLARKQLEQAEGGSLSSDEAAGLLGLRKRQSVDYQRRERALVAWRTSTGKWRYPVWQFQENGVLPGIRECLACLPGDAGFGAMIFFLSERHSLAGRRPLDLLREGKVEQAVAAAGRHDRHGAY